MMVASGMIKLNLDDSNLMGSTNIKILSIITNLGISTLSKVDDDCMEEHFSLDEEDCDDKYNVFILSQDKLWSFFDVK